MSAAPSKKSDVIGYLMNVHPMTSTTFVRREIAAIEQLGPHVHRYAIRPWSEPLVAQEDHEEQAKTHYLLSGRAGGLLKDFVTELVSNPAGMLRTLPIWWRLLRNGGGVLRHVAYLMEAVSLKRRALADGVVHIHAHFSTNTAAVAMLAEKLGGPGYSFTTHGPDELIDPGPGSLGLKLQQARFGVAISQYCKTRLALAGGQAVWDKLHVVRCGIPIEDFTPVERPVSEDAPFVCVGRLCPQKAQVLITQAVADLVGDYPNLKVIFIGDGETRGEIETLITDHGLQDNIELLGWRDNAEVRASLRTARALLLPSFAEGLPIAIMEALALKRPVISTFIAGIPELVDEDVGWIIPAGSKSHIAQAMRAALSASSDSLAAKGEEGRKRVEDHHNVNCNAKALMALIEDAISNGTVRN